MYLGEGKEDQVKAVLETDLGGSWEGVTTSLPNNGAPALTKEAELS